MSDPGNLQQQELEIFQKSSPFHIGLLLLDSESSKCCVARRKYHCKNTKKLKVKTKTNNEAKETNRCNKRIKKKTLTAFQLAHQSSYCICISVSHYLSLLFFCLSNSCSSFRNENQTKIWLHRSVADCLNPAVEDRAPPKHRRHIPRVLRIGLE